MNVKKILALGICFIATKCAFAAIEGVQVYQKNFHLYPERTQKLADDIKRYRNADDMWDVLRNEFSLPHYESNPLVQEQIEWFLTHQEFLRQSTRQAAPYLYYILQQAHKRHLPSEVVLLPVFESSFNPFAYSSAGAAGIWQMMPSTASGFGIKQDWWYDGRRDVLASTKAALNYLSYLATFFNGNWLLAIAAYDTGEGNVLNAIRRNISNGERADYWNLPLAQETRTYVPRLLALATIISHPERYPVYLPPVHNAPYLAQIDVGAQMNLKQASQFAGLSLKKIMQLNPGFNHLATSPNGPYKLILPIENVARFSENLSRSALSKHIFWQHYKTKPGDSLMAIAKQYHISIAMLRNMNQLTSNTIPSGTSLLIPRMMKSNENLDSKILLAKNTHKDTEKLFAALTAMPKQTQINSHSTNYILQPGDTIYMTRSGDTLSHIAKRFHLSATDITAANPLSVTRNTTAGQHLVIPTHLKKSTQHNPNYQLMSGDTIYMVRAGDTLEKIAQKFHTTPPAIRIANLLINNHLNDGDRLIIPTHL